MVFELGELRRCKPDGTQGAALDQASLQRLLVALGLAPPVPAPVPASVPALPQPLQQGGLPAAAEEAAVPLLQGQPGAMQLGLLPGGYLEMLLQAHMPLPPQQQPVPGVLPPLQPPPQPPPQQLQQAAPRLVEAAELQAVQEATEDVVDAVAGSVDALRVTVAAHTTELRCAGCVRPVAKLECRSACCILPTCVLMGCFCRHLSSRMDGLSLQVGVAVEQAEVSSGGAGLRDGSFGKRARSESAGDVGGAGPSGAAAVGAAARGASPISSAANACASCTLPQQQRQQRPQSA